MELNVLVLGATGRFGGVCELLLAQGHRVRVMTRVPGALRVRELESEGAEIVSGDYDDPASLARAMSGVDGAVASGTMHRAGPGAELRHGQNLATSAAEAGLPHLVFVSGADARPGTGVPILEVKAAVERHVRSSGVPSTILAPTYFMENLLNPWNREALQSGRVRSFIGPDRALQQTAIADVVSLAVLALEKGTQLMGERVEIASDELTARQSAEILARVTGHHYEVEVAPPASLDPPLTALFEWLDRVGHTVDISSLQAKYREAGWHSFENWARLQADRGTL